MNQVYISGFIVGKPVFRKENEDTPHLVFTLDVQHKNRIGKIQHEHYTINAWNNIANWAAGHLEDGKMVMLRGYLTQRVQRNEERMTVVTEVTAEEFLPVALRYIRKETKEPIEAGSTVSEDAQSM